MKTPTKILISIISFLLTFFIFYLLFAFTLMDFDASNWDVNSRAMLSLFGFTFSVFSSSLIVLYLKYN